MRTVARLLLGALLIFAGVMHFHLTDEFLGQVPTWFPARTLVVQVSGVVEVTFGTALIVVRRERGRRAMVGLAVAALFVAVFPGNISQLATGADSFGLDSTGSRVVRLFFQPLLIAWALWCTGGWRLLTGLVTGLVARRREATAGPVR